MEEPMNWGAAPPAPHSAPDVVLPAHEETQEEYQARMAAVRAEQELAARVAQRAARRAAARKVAVAVPSLVLQLAGICLVAYGLFTEWPWLGIVVAGVGVILVGVAIAPARRQAAPEQPLTGLDGQ